MIRYVLGLSLSSFAISPALATDVKIGDFVGDVVIVEGAPGIEVIRKGKHDFNHGMDDGGIFAYSDMDWKDVKEVCNGKESLEDFPKLRITIPKGSNVFIDRSYVALDTKTDIARADLQLGGCFDTQLKDVDTLYLKKSGTGEVTIGATRELDINKSGRGNIKVASASQLYLEKSGTDDVYVGAVDGPVTIERSGRGRIEIKSVSGDVRIDQSGSGDVLISGGRVGELTVDISGSGDVNVDAPVVDAFVNASGSSKIKLESVSGVVMQDTSGSSKVYVGNS